MFYVRKVLGFVVGIMFGIGSALALSPALAAFVPANGRGSAPAAMVWAVILGCGLLAAFAPTIRRAFGRGFLVLGACLSALPISAFLLSGRAASDVVSASSPDGQAFAAIGAGLAGVVVTGMATFFGLILGSIAVITGLVLVLGGRREVVIVDAPARGLPAAPTFGAMKREPPMTAPSPKLTVPQLGGVRR